MAPPDLESSADDYISSHDESGTLKLRLSSQRNFQGSAQIGRPDP
jgi:hypothetical protein